MKGTSLLTKIYSNIGDGYRIAIFFNITENLCLRYHHLNMIYRDTIDYKHILDIGQLQYGSGGHFLRYWIWA
jgi:hypothetical protein